jgi:GrpB-like predicted nucleotidyltransferase (UPF0157 family)/N-acetylglutamate synthase-like GNAT family acetyltransferase
MSDDIQIAPWTAADRADVIDLIVSIQQDEFDLPITIDDQPDLTDVDAAYRAAGGEFFVARHDGCVVGTIAALVVEDNTIALRKMFVHRDRRGGSGLAATLMETVVAWARRAGYRTIVLGTTDRMTAAHRFYEKHGFTRMAADELPTEFPRMAVDTVFFRRDLLGVVHIRPYDPRWPELFDEQRRRLEDALRSIPVVVHHAGSTSVPELPAKPIIDIVLTVPDSADEAAYAPNLTEIGYTFTLREPEWFEHRLFNRDWPRVNLHVYSTGCEEVDRMLAFRDHLRRDTGDRQLYARVKRDLAARDWQIVQDYADAKSEVVAEIMGRAL